MPTVVTDRSTFRRTARDAPDGSRIPVEIRISVEDPFRAYQRARSNQGGVYLETGGRQGWGYFAVDPIEQLQVGAELAPIESTSSSSTLDALADTLDANSLVRGECQIPYPCGAVGWLSYDIVRELEDIPSTTRDDRGLPRLELAVYDRVAAWQTETTEDDTVLRICACPQINKDVGSAYNRGLRRARELIERIVEGDDEVGPAPVQTDSATFESECGRDAFCNRVRRVKNYIREGDTFQANISHRLSAPAAVHPVEAFAALRTVNPAPYSALLEFESADLVSASPELLLTRNGEQLLTEPIAGTRPRGETPTEDGHLEDDLRTDEKERCEHAMLVDLERNDLGKVSEYGSVNVSEYRRVDRYAEVMHLVSKVEGTIRDDRDLGDAIAAVFPGGTITGAPKPRTMEIIEEMEDTRRGPYTGSIGIFGFDGRATLNIVIRTLVRQANEYHLRVGAGIVHDSVPDQEYEETLDKARALVTAVSEALETRQDLAVEEIDRQ